MGYSGKLIDFDDSYFSGNPPTDRESLVGTPEYYSPEQAAYIMDEDEEIEGSTLTLKSDIFTLGIILCEYFTGKKPILPSDCRSTWICVEKGKPFSYAKRIPTEITNIIDWMLRKNPNERPTINEVFEILKGMKKCGSSLKDGDSHSIRDFVAPISLELSGKVKIRSTFKDIEKKEEHLTETKGTSPVSIERKTRLRSKTWDVNK